MLQAMSRGEGQQTSEGILCATHLEQQLSGQEASNEIRHVPCSLFNDVPMATNEHSPSSQFARNGSASPSHDWRLTFSRTCLDGVIYTLPATFTLDHSRELRPKPAGDGGIAQELAEPAEVEHRGGRRPSPESCGVGVWRYG